MKVSQLIVTAAIFAVCGSGNELFADNTADEINKLKRENEVLQQKVKGLEEQLNQRFRVLEEQINRKPKPIDQKPNIENEPATAKLTENASPFKVPGWVTGIRLINDLRLRYDQIYAPDSDFVTRSRIRARLRLGAIAALKDDWEIGVRLTSAPSIGRDSGGDPLSTQATFE